MTEFVDLPIGVLTEVAEYAYADDPDVEIIEGGIHDQDAPHGINAPGEMAPWRD